MVNSCEGEKKTVFPQCDRVLEQSNTMCFSSHLLKSHCWLFKCLKEMYFSTFNEKILMSKNYEETGDKLPFFHAKWSLGIIL